VLFWAYTLFERQGRLNAVKSQVRADCSNLSYQFDRILAPRDLPADGGLLGGPTRHAGPNSNILDEIRAACGHSDMPISVNNPVEIASIYFRMSPSDTVALSR